MSRSAIVERPIDPSALIAEVSSPECGAVSLFIGTVRNESDGRGVDGIDYTAYIAMAEAELARIVAEATERFAVISLVAEHRIGSLNLGEVSVGIAAAHPHRGPAMGSVQYVIEEIKKRVPVWKLEHYTDGTRAWVDTTVHHAEVRA